MTSSWGESPKRQKTGEAGVVWSVINLSGSWAWWDAWPRPGETLNRSLTTSKTKHGNKSLSRWFCMCKSMKMWLIPWAPFYEPCSILYWCHERSTPSSHKLVVMPGWTTSKSFLIAKLLGAIHMTMSIASANPPSHSGKKVQRLLICQDTNCCFCFCFPAKHLSQSWYSRKHSLSNLVLEEENISFSSGNMRISRDCSCYITHTSARRQKPYLIDL